MFAFLLVLQALVAAALIAVILMQKSEGGGLGTGGSPTGFLSARGAADFMTRTTAILASLFVALCIALAVLASVQHKAGVIDTRGVGGGTAAPALPTAPSTPAVPVGGGAPLNPVQGVPAIGVPAPAAPASGVGTNAPAPAAPASSVPVQK